MLDTAEYRTNALKQLSYTKSIISEAVLQRPEGLDEARRRQLRHHKGRPGFHFLPSFQHHTIWNRIHDGYINKSQTELHQGSFL